MIEDGGNRIERPAILLAAALALSACSATIGEDAGRRPASPAGAAAHQDRYPGSAATPAAVEPRLKDKGAGQPLKSGALHAVLTDAYVEPVRPAGQENARNWPGEIFQSDGYYARVENGTRRYGGFQVYDDILCVEGDGIERYCRYLIPNSIGTYYFREVSSKSRTRVTIRSRHVVNNWLVDGEAPAYIDYEDHRYTKLSGSAVFATLSGRMLRHAPGSLLSRKYFTESFSKGGAYTMTVQEAPFRGISWKIVDDRVCVTAVLDSGQPLCRHLYLNEDGTLVLLVESSGDRRHYALKPIER